MAFPWAAFSAYLRFNRKFFFSDADKMMRALHFCPHVSWYALAEYPPALLGESKKALASSYERSEILTTALRWQKAAVRAVIASLRALGQVMQEKENSVRLETLAGYMPF